MIPRLTALIALGFLGGSGIIASAQVPATNPAPAADKAAAEAKDPGGASRTPEQLIRLLQQRKRQQEAASVVCTAFHGFQFVNRIQESGILFRPQVVDDVGRHNKPVHYDHGVGLAVADVDHDGLLDVYFVGQSGGSQLWRNRGQGRFEDITASAGVALRDRISVAAAFADVDNDGDPDLLVTTVRTGNVLFENLGGAKFRDISREAGLDYTGHSSGAVFFDYDRDGWLDLFVCNVGKYTTDKRGRGGYFVGRTNAFSGHLFPELNEPSLLYRNLGSKHFTNVTAHVLQHIGWSGEAVFGDLNEDGYPDLYVLNMQGDDRCYLNRNGRSFEERTADYFPKTPWGAMGAKFFDFNNDGRQDLFLTDMHSDMTSQQTLLQRGFDRGMEKTKSEAFCKFEWDEAYLGGSSNNLFGNAFFLNRGQGRFVEVSDEINAETYWPWGPSVGDLNADGFQDVFIPSGMGYPYGYSMNALLLNEQGRRFCDAEFLLGIEPRLNNQISTEYFILDCNGEDKDHPECRGHSGRISVYGVVSSRSSALLDLDEDGDLDILSHELLEKPQVLLSNLTAQKKTQYLKIRLVGRQSNRDGLGATVRVTAGGLSQSQYHDGKSGYLAQSASLPLYFGLGEAAAIDRIEVRWPSGKVQVLDRNLKINSLLRIEEPE